MNSIIFAPCRSVFLSDGRGNSSTHCYAYPIDKIKLSRHGSEAIFEKASQLYASGSSFREIAKELGVCKTTVRKSLIRGGVDIRPAAGRPAKSISKTNRQHVGSAPYGYFVIKGGLVENHKEQITLQNILKLRADGKSWSDIATYLNRQKIKPRLALQWDHSSVRKIILRLERQDLLNQKLKEEAS